MLEIIELVKSVTHIIFDESYVNAQETKGESDYVTLVDIKVQEHIFKGLKTLFPNHQFLGEESQNHNFDFTKPTWILDPIDGTTNLIHDFQQSAVSLALWNNGRIELGVIFNPFTNELFSASIDKGAYLNGKAIHVSDHTSMKDSLISVGTSPYDKDDSKGMFLTYHEMFLACQDIRRIGSAALELAYIAAGRIDAYFERSLMPWDYAAGYIILREAGGKITTFDNDPVPITEQCSVLATNGGIHPLMLDYLAK